MHYYIYHNLCKPECIDGNFDQFVIDYFYELINNN